MAEDNNKQVGNPDKDNVANTFVGIPIAELVAAPLVAVCDSQKRLAQSAFEFMQEIDFTEDGETRMVESDFQRPIEGSPTPRDVTPQVPMLTIVPIPYIGINDVQVDFEMEVIANKSSESTID